MEKSTTKKISIFALLILLIASMILCVGCTGLDDETKNKLSKLEGEISQLQDKIGDLEQNNLELTKQLSRMLDANAIAVFNNGVNMQTNPAGQMEVKSTGMTEYKGITGWELNSVDFVETQSQPQWNSSYGMAYELELYGLILNSDKINLFDDYAKLDQAPLYDQTRIKFELIGNNLIMNFIVYSNGRSFLHTLLINFNSSDYSINSVIKENEAMENVVIYANGKVYEAQLTGDILDGFKAKANAEKAKPVKNEEAYDMDDIL